VPRATPGTAHRRPPPRGLLCLRDSDLSRPDPFRAPVLDLESPGVALRIVALEDVDPEDAHAFGGKAAGLARLRRMGAAVPDAVLVAATTRSPADWTEEERSRLRAVAAVLLHGGAVAVRSSAVGEDSAQRSFAGLFETVLGVSDVDAVEAGAGRGIASAGAQRVRAYAGPDATLPVGLVVQRQVDARAAGVCFTRDPTGRDRAILIEAGVGLADGLVSGHVRPERWRVYQNGIGTFEARREDGAVSVLGSAEAVAVAREAADLEARHAHPLDLEWALEKGTGRLFWLQARPITASAAPPEISVERGAPPGDDGPVTVWCNFNIRETMPDPFTPMNWCLWRDVVLPATGEDLFAIPRDSELMRSHLGIDLVEGRLYWNMNALIGGLMGRFLTLGPHGTLHALDPEAARITEELLDAGILRPRRMASGLRPGVQLAWAGARSIARMLAAARPRRTLAILRDAARLLRERPPLAGLEDADLLHEATLMGDPLRGRFRRSMHTMVFAFLVYVAARRAFAAHPRAQALLTAGIVGPTTEISLGIDRLVERARPLARHLLETSSIEDVRRRLAGTAEGRAWLAALDAFLEENGQRCPQEFEIATPRWAEDPTMILELVRAGLRSGSPPAGAGERLARARAERERALAEALAASRFWRRPLMRWLAHAVTRFMPHREAPKHYTMHVFLRMRLALLELGRRLAARGALDRAEDVMFLDLAEVRAALSGQGGDLRGRVAFRRSRWETFRRLRSPHFVRSDGVPVEAATPARPDGRLVGVGVSGGTASGTVRVLHEPDPSRLQDGDVLVVEFADPGWTPLFPRVAAVVMEVGGTMCHAAVVARELGVPAVFGVAGATTALRDGTRIVVDGDEGTVAPA
jgi:phosphohistidine swiveling domain-containing protein